jgi:signal transduction histidine kinase
MERLDRIERAQQRLWLLALLLFLLLAAGLFLLDAISVVEERAAVYLRPVLIGRLRDYGPSAALLVIATLTCIYFYEKLVSVRTANRELVKQLETSARTLAQRNQQLATWSQLSHSLITNFNLPRLLDLIVHTAAEVAQADCGAVILAERGARHLRLAAIHERGLQIELAERVAALVVETKRPLSLLPESPPPELDRPDLPWEDLASLAAEPLVTAEQVVGALLVGRVKPHEPFSTEVRETLESFANQASVALEKAHLYAENQRQLDRLEKLLDDLHVAQAQLSEAGRAAGQGVLPGGVSYVVNQPLAAILALSDRLLDRQDWDEKAARGEVSAIREQAARATHTLVGLLAVSRQPSKASSQDVDINATLSHTLAILRAECAAAGIELEESYETLPSMKASSFQLQQAFLNLIVAALHALPGGGRLGLRTSAPSPDWAEIDIEYARPVPVSASAEELEAFGVPHADQVEVALGLAAASRLVRSQGGTTRVDGDTGLGARVVVRLPILRNIDLIDLTETGEQRASEDEPEPLLEVGSGEQAG